MFFGQQESIDINKFIKEEWISLLHFSEMLDEEDYLVYQGYGFFSYRNQSQFDEFLGYYLLKITDKLFAFVGESYSDKKVEENEPIKFKKVIELDEKLLATNLFESTHGNSSNYYKNFEAELIIDAKVYQYSDEDKILLTKKGQGNIDLYASYQVKNENNELAIKIQQSAFTTARHLAMTQVLEKRIQNMKK
jgi:hypothetical protein